MSETVIEVIGLAKRYGLLTAKEDVSFSVENGQIMRAFGPNGEGKTTLLEMIEEIQQSDAGYNSDLAERIRQRNQEAIAHIGVQLLTTALFRWVESSRATLLIHHPPSRRRPLNG